MMKRILLSTILLLSIKLFAQVTTEDLILYMPFSGSAIDESGNEYDGVVNGAVLTTDRFGFSNSAYSFDGTNDYIEIDSFGSNVPTKEITVSFWAKSYASKAQFQLMLCPDDDSRFAVSANFLHAGYNTVFWDFGWEGDGGDADGRLYYRPEPFDTLWHHYVYVSSIEESIMKIYEDDTLLVTKEEPLTLYNNSGKSLKIGCGDGINFFNGLIDDLRIYGRALDTTEMHNLYEETTPCVNYVTVYDTVTVTVTDTLLVKVENVSSVGETSSTIKVFPNPTNDIINITFDDYSSLYNYSLKIINVQSQVVFESDIDESEFQVNIDDFGSTGLYFMQVINDNSEIIDIKKIVLN